MPNVAAINSFLQRRLCKDNLEVTGVEAAAWLDSANLLKDSPSRPGKPLRDLLRAGRMLGARQETNGRWFIGCVSQVTSVLPQSAASVGEAADEQLPPSLREGVDVVFVGVAPGKESLRLGCYYADSRNSFWKHLYSSGFTDRLYEPCEYPRLLELEPSVGLDDVYDDPEGLVNRLSQVHPQVVVFNSKKAFSLVERNIRSRSRLSNFALEVLDDSSNRAARWHARRLAKLIEIRRQFRIGHRLKP